MRKRIMKSIIVYFSQTGNTRKIATAIYAGMSPVVEQCDIRRLKDVNPNGDLKDYDLIGLGAPVWGEGMPHIMGFIDNITRVEGKHAFAFCTHGTYPRSFLSSVVPGLTQRGLTVIGWNDWHGSVCIPMMPKPYFTDGHPDEIDLKEARDFGRDLVERSRRIYQGERHLIPVFSRGRDYDEIYGTMGRVLSEECAKAGSYPFKVNLDKCNQCNLCVENCPTNSIDFSESPPIFRPNYARCWFCEQICPQGAIEYNWEPAAAATRKDFLRIFVPTLKKAEERGHFRKLVPDESVGYDTPWYKIKQPPRLSPLTD